jgi:hypothetical protein
VSPAQGCFPSHIDIAMRRNPLRVAAGLRA